MTLPKLEGSRSATTYAQTHHVVVVSREELLAALRVAHPDLPSDARLVGVEVDPDYDPSPYSPPKGPPPTRQSDPHQLEVRWTTRTP